jgi:hypothetical protein
MVKYTEPPSYKRDPSHPFYTYGLLPATDFAWRFNLFSLMQYRHLLKTKKGEINGRIVLEIAKL